MVLKLYGHNICARTRLVALILYEKEVPFEYHVVDLFKGEHKSAQYAKKQPFRLVPYIDDEGFILYESRAIAYYIATKFATQGMQLIPTELKANALFQQAASMEIVYFNEYAEKVVQEILFNPLKGIPSVPAISHALIAVLSDKLDVYDEILSRQKYLSGDEITLADLNHVPMGAMLQVAGSNIIETKPNVHRWFSAMLSRPSWQAVKGLRGIKDTVPTEVSAGIQVRL